MQAKIARLLGQSLDDQVTLTQFPIDKTAWDPDKFQQDQCDVLIISRHLPDANVLPWLKDNASDINFPVVVLLSKDSNDEFNQKVEKIGVFKCLNKNLLTRSLLSVTVNDAIEQTLDKPAAVNKSTSTNENSPLDELNRPSLDSYQPARDQQRKIRKPRARKANPLDASNKRFSEKQTKQNMIDGYLLQKKIGQGGMSVIYLAKRLEDNQDVVIKVLSDKLSQSDLQVLRSNQEYKLISRINSPHIVRLTDHGIVNGSTYTVMEHFDSGDLKQRMQKGITQIQALKFLQQICHGLAAIHGSGIIHRDLKPANIMFREDDTLAIIDFGISRDINTNLNLTRPGQIIGTPNYMAPEQGNSSYKPDARCDIYAVGVMLYEMLTGNKPYTAANAASIIYKHLHDPIPKLPNNFFEMQGIVDNCMAKFPHQRFQSAIDMIEYINTEFRWDITLDFE